MTPFELKELREIKIHGIEVEPAITLEGIRNLEETFADLLFDAWLRERKK